MILREIKPSKLSSEIKTEHDVVQKDLHVIQLHGGDDRYDNLCDYQAKGGTSDVRMEVI